MSHVPRRRPRAMTTAEFLASRAAMQPPAIETVTFGGTVRKIGRRMMQRGDGVMPVDGPITNVRENMRARDLEGRAAAASIAAEHRWRPNSYLPIKQIYIQLKMLHARMTARRHGPFGIVGQAVGAIALYFVVMWGTGLSGIEAKLVSNPHFAPANLTTQMNTAPTGIIKADAPQP